MTRFSVVIPAYNEEAYLPRLLETLDRARDRYPGGTEKTEVIVADNMSTDRTAAIAAEHGCIVVKVEKRVIAAARNGGATVARGEILAFVDADTQVHPDTLLEIDRLLATGRYVGGATGITFERSSAGIRWTHAMLVLMGSVIRVAAGDHPARQVDTGVTFCRRSDFEAIGGYNERRYFAEDVQFMVDLSRQGQRRGEYLVEETNAPAIFSARKFDRYGDWHYFKAPFWMPFSALLNPSAINSKTRRYWYEDR